LQPGLAGENLMSKVVDAIYENPVLRPATPVVGLSEGQRVWVTMDEGEHLAAIRAEIDDTEAGHVVSFEDVDARINGDILRSLSG
jgi:predicted DNA-binding antitoxin AbrB/MazE fold protein